MKKAILLLAFAVVMGIALCGCSLFQLGRTPAPTRWTPGPSGAPTQAITSVPPGKTASQDTAGAVTKLPEAATAAGATATKWQK